MKKIIILISIIFIIKCIINDGSTLFAQDVHFAQFSETPLLMNPALAGGFKGDYRFILNHRNQWGILKNTFSTQAFSVDAALKSTSRKSRLGAGVSIFSDRAGSLKYGNTQINLSIANHLLLNESNQLSVGIQTAFTQHGLQINKSEEGVLIDENDIAFSGKNIEGYFIIDAAAGVMWNFSRRETAGSNSQLKFNLGLSLYHINTPKDKFGDMNDKQDMRFLIHGSGDVGIPYSKFSLEPSYLIAQQGKHSETVLGLMIRSMIVEGSRYTSFVSERAVLVGCKMRLNDAFIPCVGIEFGEIAVGISYDLTISQLQVANINGGTEVSLRYIFADKKNKTNSVKFY